MTSSRDPEMQNLRPFPTVLGDYVRDVMRTTYATNNSIVQCDFAGLELRAMAHQLVPGAARRARADDPYLKDALELIARGAVRRVVPDEIRRQARRWYKAGRSPERIRRLVSLKVDWLVFVRARRMAKNRVFMSAYGAGPRKLMEMF